MAVRIAKVAVLVLLAIIFAGVILWGTAALYFAAPATPAVRAGLAGAFALIGLAALATPFVKHWRRPVLAAFLASFGLLLGWWATLEPSNQRDWPPEVAVMPYADLDGDLVTVRNVRNFDYRSESDFTPRYYDKTYDLRKLESVDLFAVYWMGPHIAHTILSFGFEGGEQLAVSIETRKEKNESYSALGGFFRQYELFYVVADERDVIRLRTNYRKDPPEDVYLYRLHGPAENGRRLLREYLHKINSLRSEPEFYNTLTANCTGNIWLHSRVNPGHLPFSWKLLASGHVPEYLHQAGKLDPHGSFAELAQRSHINARAQAADKAEDFSRRIRLTAVAAR
ncbi:MAG TPA: DUF4105 domain-containing protein [Burkholderiales bacterium]|nr:DUF4105 domain-containing protein [Burkholderiales bacterium]